MENTRWVLRDNNTSFEYCYKQDPASLQPCYQGWLGCSSPLYSYKCAKVRLEAGTFEILKVECAAGHEPIIWGRLLAGWIFTKRPGIGKLIAEFPIDEVCIHPGLIAEEEKIRLKDYVAKSSPGKDGQLGPSG